MRYSVQRTSHDKFRGETFVMQDKTHGSAPGLRNVKTDNLQEKGATAVLSL